MNLETIKQWLLTNDRKINEFIDKYFAGNIETFIKFVEDKQIIDDDEVAEYFLEEFPIEYLLEKYRKNPEKTIDFILGYFNDIVKEGDTYWMGMGSREDLANFFKEEYRGGGARDAAKGVLSDDWPDWWYWDGKIDDLEEMLNNLSGENLAHLKERVYDEVKGQELEVDGEMKIITKDIVTDMDNDELSKFIEEYVMDVYILLNQLLNAAQESAYYDEVYDNTMSELKDLFRVENFSRETPRKVNYLDKNTGEKKEKTVYEYNVNVTNLIKDAIETVFKHYGREDRNEFEYQGSFENLLIELFSNYWDYLDFRIPEWPSFDRVEKNIDDMLRDYI
jgi:hypothetical protein